MEQARPGQQVQTPDGSGRVLCAVPGTQRRRWIILRGRVGEEYTADAQPRADARQHRGLAPGEGKAGALANRRCGQRLAGAIAP